MIFDLLQSTDCAESVVVGKAEASSAGEQLAKE